MKNLIIIFNKLDVASEFNNSKIEVCDYLIDFDEEIGFSEDLNHFYIIKPGKDIINNSFSTNEQNFNKFQINLSEVLMIQLSENIEAWNEDFKNDFITYASKFDNIYVSYHKGPNDGDDIRNGKHRLIENYLVGQTIITTDKYHHDFFMGEEEQLYGVLANAIFENKGVFTEESYNSLVDKLVSCIEPSTNDELELIHHCLTNVGTNSLSQKGEEYLRACIDQYEQFVKSTDGLKKIHKILNKKSMTL